MDQIDNHASLEDYSIAGYQFVVIAADASTWTYWPNIPNDAFKIVLDGARLFNGLSNSGDVVILYDDRGNQIDEVSWGSNATGLNPAVADVAEGHSISRIEKGVDTDSYLDWMDTYSGSTPSGPNPGTNPHSDDGILLPPLSPITRSDPEPVIPKPFPEPTDTDDTDDTDDDVDTNDNSSDDTINDDADDDDMDNDTTEDVDTTDDSDTDDDDDTDNATSDNDTTDDDTTTDSDNTDSDEEKTDEETKREVDDDDATESIPEDKTGNDEDSNETDDK